MYHNRELLINGISHEVIWPDADASCWDLIVADWGVMSEPIHKLVRGNKVVVQAGGNCGMYPLLYSKTFHRVITFEMDSVCFTALAKNCNVPSITRLNAAVGDQAQFIKYSNREQQNVGMGTILDPGESSLPALMVTIDSLNLRECNLIHLDVEGAEINALRGAVATIGRHRPLIVLEMSNFIAEINEFMHEHNYMEVFVFDPLQVRPLNIIFGPKEYFL